MSNQESLDAESSAVEGRPRPARKAADAPTSSTKGGQVAKPRKAALMTVAAAALLAGVVIGGLLAHWRDKRPKPFAFINNAIITRAQFEHALAAAAGNQVAQSLTDNTLKMQFLAQQGVMPTAQQIDDKISEIQKNNPKVIAALAGNHQTIDDLRQQLAISMGMQTLLTQGVSVSDAEVSAFYKRNTDPRTPHALFYKPASVQCEVIACANKTALKAAVDALAHGADFGAVAKQYSEDTSKANGGLLPLIVPGSLSPQQYPGMEKLMFSMAPGSVKSGFNCAGHLWIIKCLGRTAPITVPFAQAQTLCKQDALLLKGNEINGPRVQGQLIAFAKKARIISADPAYRLNVGG